MYKQLGEIVFNTDLLKQMYNRGFIGGNLEDIDRITITDKGSRFLNSPPDDENDTKRLAEEMTNLFPAGVKTMGYYVRGNKNSTYAKLRSLRKKVKFTNEDALKATKQYVDRMEKNGWQGMQIIHYFISKNGVSNLLSEIDQLEKKTDYSKDI